MASPRPEHRYLRSALEYAVLVARQRQKQRPPLPVPAALKPYVKPQRVPSIALGRIRRAIEDDATFRSEVAATATPELVDEIGFAWLCREPGWEVRVDELVADAIAAAEQAEAGADAHRERKRREKAEEVAARTRIEMVALERRAGDLVAEVDAERATNAELCEQLDTVRSELREARTDARHANDRALAAARRLERAEAAADAAGRDRAHAEEVRDEVLADRVTDERTVARLHELAAVARTVADGLSAVIVDGGGDTGGSGETGTRGRQRRRALSLPGGVAGDSEIATEHLLRSGASILVDGYNVAKLGWPDFDLAVQRSALLDAVEALARRFGADLTVVFDGAGVVGAVADQRRLVRVVYSPAGVTADDVIRAEVERLPAGRPVVVVTNDKAIVRDVRSQGANTVSSDAFVRVSCR